MVPDPITVHATDDTQRHVIIRRFSLEADKQSEAGRTTTCDLRKCVQKSTSGATQSVPGKPLDSNPIMALISWTLSINRANYNGRSSDKCPCISVHCLSIYSAGSDRMAGWKTPIER